MAKGIRKTLGLVASAQKQFGSNPDNLSESPDPLPLGAFRPLVASGEKINLKSTTDVMLLRNRIHTEWQNDAWAFYDAIGEIKYAFGMAANVVSRIRLFAALGLEQDAVPIAVDSYRDKMVETSEKEKQIEAQKRQALPARIDSNVLDYAEKLVRELVGSGMGGQSGIMRAFALNMLVAGECFLVKYRGQWSIRSSSEIYSNGGGEVVLRTTRGGTANAFGGVENEIKLPKSTPMYRIWREHPRFSGEPDSSMLSLREICDEVITLQRNIRTIGRSQMNAGILFLPDTLSAAGSSVTDDVVTAEEEMDAIATAIYDSITAPIADETNAASVAPPIVTGPPEVGASIKHITLSRQADQFLVARLEAAMGRLLNGLDIPKDMVEGMAGVRYSNAQTMNGHMYQAQIEPLVLMLCDSLTQVYLRPLIKKQFPHLTAEDLEYFCIWYDPSEVVTKSDPTASADKGLEVNAISTAVWRRAHGYSDADAPTEQELALRYLLMKAPPQPEHIDMLFKAGFPNLVDTARKANLDKAPVPMPESAQKMLYGKIVSSPQDDATMNAAHDPKTNREYFDPPHREATLPPDLAPGLQGESENPLPQGINMSEAGAVAADPESLAKALDGGDAASEPADDEFVDEPVESDEPLQTEFDLDGPTEDAPVEEFVDEEDPGLEFEVQEPNPDLPEDEDEELE